MLFVLSCSLYVEGGGGNCICKWHGTYLRPCHFDKFFWLMVFSSHRAAIVRWTCWLILSFALCLKVCTPSCTKSCLVNSDCPGMMHIIVGPQGRTSRSVLVWRSLQRNSAVPSRPPWMNWLRKVLRFCLKKDHIERLLCRPSKAWP